MNSKSAVADTQQANLYWRGAYAYFRKRIGKKDHWESMGELPPEAARRLVRDKRKMAAEQAYLERWGLKKLRSDFSTLGELFTAYDLFTAGRNMETATVRTNKSAMRNIFRKTHNQPRTFDVDDMRLGLLDVPFVKAYEAKIIEARKLEAETEGWDKERRELELAKASRTAGSTWNQAKSLFSAEALKSPAYQDLSLPDLTEARDLQIGSSTIVAYRRPPQEVLDRITAAVPALREDDPALWLALNLEINLALRRSSGVWAKWDWLQERGVDLDGRAVYEFEVRVAKGNNNVIRVDPELAREMLKLKPELGAEFIVPGKTDKDRDAVFVRLCAWLRKQGLQDVEKPNHLLRKWCADETNAKHGLAEASNLLGHSSQKLTSAVYVKHRATKTNRVV
jgi:integrase